MTNLKIEDIETLERLSLDDMNQVVGGCVDFQELRELLPAIAKTDIIPNVTFDEPYFPEHFPGRPLMPGVLQ
ncbi:MAG: hypothetical protein QNJ55_01675 [Xenococcus sp. MO_188.B8]|nr:hypothetical protein [Xenococcus sp. MO_188.B8]